MMKNVWPMLATCVVAGAVLTVLAPFGSHSLGVMPRAAYWIGLCLVGGLAVALTNIIVLRLGFKPGPIAQVALHSIASSLAVFGMLLGMLAYQQAMPDGTGHLRVFFYIWVIAATISLVGLLSDRRKQNTDSSHRPALYERLKPRLRQSVILALSAEDHYVRVITDKGEDLVLMRLSDAVKETAPLKGLSPHRSWWVAEQGVQQASRKVILLHTGQAVPVSRNGSKTIKDAGWA